MAIIICLVLSALPQTANAQTGKTHLNKSSITVQEGATCQAKLLTAKNKVIRASAVTWSTSDKKIASVSKKGLIRGKDVGQAKITAKYKGKKYVLKVFVKSLWDAPEAVSFNTALKDASEYHRMLQSGKDGFGDFKKYIVNDPAVKNLLTQEEIDTLRNYSGSGKERMSLEEAAADVDLYFRALKYGYGAYYYFGGDEAFDAAKKKVMDSFLGKKTVTWTQLAVSLQNAMKFCRDGHFWIAGVSPVDDVDVRYEYYYCYDQIFSKDENGCYKMKNGKKWYFDGFSKNSGAEIRRSLLPAGEIVYSPVLFCPKSKAVKSETVILRNGSKTMKETFNWTLSKSYADRGLQGDTWYNFFRQEDVTYISVRCFDGDVCKEDLNSHFVPDAVKAKDSKAIIFDIRSNGGGSEEFCRQWIKNFIGIEPELCQAFAARRNGLNPYGGVNLGQEKFEGSVMKGKFISNDIPVIVLTDDCCGSSGESMLNFLKSMDNVVVVGSNSNGAQISGNVYGYRLPNSGIGVGFGMNLSLCFDTQKVDGKGYEPDVWCNPKDAYQAVLRLLEKENYLTKSGRKQMASADELNDVTIDWGISSKHPGQSFGRIVEEKVVVRCNGKVIRNYEVKSESKELEAEKLPNGKLFLKAVPHIPKMYFTITYKGKDYKFICGSC